MLEQRASDLSRHTMGQGEKCDLSAASGDFVWIRENEFQFSLGGTLETRKDRSDGLAGFLARGCGHQINSGVGEQEAQQLHAGVATGSNHGGLDAGHGGMASHGGEGK